VFSVFPSFFHFRITAKCIFLIILLKTFFDLSLNLIYRKVVFIDIRIKLLLAFYLFFLSFFNHQKHFISKVVETSKANKPIFLPSSMTSMPNSSFLKQQL
jgi:hypothetical protein